MGGFVLRFTGTTRIAVVLKGTRDFIGRDFLYYVCKIDGRSPREDGDVGGDGIGVWRDGRATPGGSGTLTIATDLVATEEYTVRCGRSSEASYADTLFMGIEADPGERSSMSFILEISFKGFRYDTNSLVTRRSAHPQIFPPRYQHFQDMFNRLNKSPAL